MCGLAGGISDTLTPSERSVIRTLIGMSYYRGSHSTGMMSWSRLKNLPDTAPKKDKQAYVPLHYYKSLAHPLDFIDKEYDDAEQRFWKDAAPTFIAGHARHATKGQIIRENAHPFNCSPIYGMHNGTIDGEWYDKVKFKTDSEAIFDLMKKDGLHKTLEHIHEYGVSPAYALVWFDKTAETLNFVRNYQRPLHIATLTSGRTWYWASDAELLRWVFFQHKITGYTIQELPINQHFAFKLRDENLKLEEQEELPDGAKWKQYKGTVPYSNSAYSSSGYTSYYQQTKNGPKDYGGVDNPDYYIKYGKKAKDAFFSEYDVKSQLYLSPFQYKETIKWRELANLKANMKLEAEKEKGGSQTANQNFPFRTQPTASFSTIKSRFDKTGQKATKEANSKKPRPVKDGNVIDLFPNITDESVATELTNVWGPTNTKCTKSEWYMKTKEGCLWCGNPVTENEYLFWGDKTSFLCECCSDKVRESHTEAKDILGIYPPAFNLLSPSPTIN